jgi:Kef-type K+ transport system membrane component KefB/CBS domain-containing protein
MDHLANTLLSLGLSYLAALLAARIVIHWYIPRVTGYLLVGLLVGPSLSELLGYPTFFSWDSLRNLEVLSDIALALIMLTIGSQFRSEYLRRWGRRLVAFSACEMIVTFLFVSVAIFIANRFLVRAVITGELGVSVSSVYLAVFTGIIAIATAPAATLLVIREYKSEGPVTDIVLALVGFNNLFSILAFSMVAQCLFQIQTSVADFLFRLFLPIGIGFVTGIAMSVWAEKMEDTFEWQLLLMGGIIANIGLAYLLRVDIYIVCFTCGLALVNASPKAVPLLKALQAIDYPLYVIFFVIAGASLHIDALLCLGFLGGAYILMRTSGKLFGNWLGAKLGGFGETERRWIGCSMMAQAGVAIGLSQSLVRMWPEGGYLVQTIILGSVVIFELLGPVSVRYGLVHAGEVPVLTLLAKRAPEGSFEGFHHVINHFRLSLGIPFGHKMESAADILIQHVMRKNVETISESATFNELLYHVAHSRYDRFPIVDSEKNFIGLVDYRDIRDVVVDDTLSHLVLVRDMVKPEPLALRPGQNLGEALRVFKEHSDISYLPVIDANNPRKLLGIISQNDVLATFRRQANFKMTGT